MKIAVVTSRFPYPLEKGDKLRVYHQIRLLSQKHDIVLIALTETPVKTPDKKELEKYCSAIYILSLSKVKIAFSLTRSLFNNLPLQVAYFFDKKQIGVAREILKNEKPDHIFAQLIRTVPYVEKAGGIKTLDYMDAFSAIAGRWAKRVPWPFKIFWERQSKKINRYDKSVYQKFDHHLIISEPDKQIMKLDAGQTLKVVNNGVDFEYFQPDFNARKTFDIAFVGNMGYTPNVEAAKFLVKEVLPIIHQKKPEVKILLSGARPSREVRSLEGRHVKVTGWVEDIRDSYNSAKVFAAPLFLGAGMQNKILEAMCMHLPCVTTSRVNNAIKADDGDVVLVANTANEFAEAIINLLENEKLRKKISASAYNFALQNFSWEATVDQIEHILLSHEKQIQHNT